MLAETKATPPSTDTYYALGDANGNVTEYIDSTGAVKAHYEYSAFGEITAQSGVMADEFSFRFSTKYYNPETGLYYYGYRYYDVVLMRWLSRDPIGEQGGLNQHGFVDNDAINWFDSLGDKKSKGRKPTWLAFLKAAKEIHNNYETYKNLTSQAKDTFKNKINPCYDCCWKGKPNYKVSDWDEPDNQNVGWQVLHRQMGCELKRAGASQEAMALLNVLYETKTSIYEMLAKLKLNPKGGIDDWINDTARDMAAVMEGWNNGGGDCTTKFIPSECKKIK
ncbi:MAG: RHS repeat-associated core domain-containing protein [Candidatus Cloacimonetes bacterium]|nr:RHS repeat-associated core domain-containing protein [Candidatus Cloacimonadota bacterium]